MDGDIIEIPGSQCDYCGVIIPLPFSDTSDRYQHSNVFTSSNNVRRKIISLTQLLRVKFHIKFVCAAALSFAWNEPKS